MQRQPRRKRTCNGRSPGSWSIKMVLVNQPRPGPRTPLQILKGLIAGLIKGNPFKKALYFWGGVRYRGGVGWPDFSMVFWTQLVCSRLVNIEPGMRATTCSPFFSPREPFFGYRKNKTIFMLFTETSLEFESFGGWFSSGLTSREHKNSCFLSPSSLVKITPPKTPTCQDIPMNPWLLFERFQHHPTFHTGSPPHHHVAWILLPFEAVGTVEEATQRRDQWQWCVAT